MEVEEVHMEAVVRMLEEEEEAEATEEVVVLVLGATAVGDLIQAAEEVVEDAVDMAADVEEATEGEEAGEEPLAEAEVAADSLRNSTLGRFSSGASLNETPTAIRFNSSFRLLER